MNHLLCHAIVSSYFIHYINSSNQRKHFIHYTGVFVGNAFHFLFIRCFLGNFILSHPFSIWILCVFFCFFLLLSIAPKNTCIFFSRSNFFIPLLFIRAEYKIKYYIEHRAENIFFGVKMLSFCERYTSVNVFICNRCDLVILAFSNIPTKSLLHFNFRFSFHRKYKCEHEQPDNQRITFSWHFLFCVWNPEFAF